ncbi:hypothetical protein AAHA92_30753 [Salvia divinorum]|uniref:Uncharacterized protein n=1 Tax=Salvia divinorum TaxID=28513 RepID=A0ABD1FRX5_SALDI
MIGLGDYFQSGGSGYGRVPRLRPGIFGRPRPGIFGTRPPTPLEIFKKSRPTRCCGKSGLPLPPPTIPRKMSIK